MAVWIRSLFAAVLVAAPCGATASADIIYDNTANTGGQGTTTTASQLGNEVTAGAGTGRSVTELDIGFTPQNVAATANLQAFLYAYDGPGGAPGTLLWSSAVQIGVNFAPGINLIAFSVPNVTVPDTFTWTAAISNDPLFVSFVPANPPTTGTYAQNWIGGSVPWQATADPIFDVEARVLAGPSVQAVPEPSVSLLCGQGLICAVIFSRFGRMMSRKAVSRPDAE